MALGQKVLCAGIVIFFCILLAAQTSMRIEELRAGETASLPLELLRPRYGEEPRFPQDYVIGRLGRCDAPEESYQYARRLTAGLAGGNGKTNGVIFPEHKRLSVLQGIAGLGTRSWRVGGGRVEPDGSISFLIRFLGREKSITGELYLRRPEPAGTQGIAEETAGSEKTAEREESAEHEDAAWRVDDILLEPPRGLVEGKYSPGGSDMIPYERFF